MRGIYFSVKDDTEGFRLPVNPEKVSVKNEASGEVFHISKLGAVKVPRGIELSEFDLECFFPAQDYHFLETEFKEPSFYIDKINKWMKEKEPVRYIYVDGSFSINELVLIDSFPYDESYGTADVNYALSMTKYVPFGPRKLKIEKPKSDGTNQSKPAVKKDVPPTQNQKVVPQTYSLVRGDSLWKVAQKYTGNGNNYPALAKLNGIQPSQYRKLAIGLKLKIPPEWTKK